MKNIIEEAGKYASVLTGRKIDYNLVLNSFLFITASIAGMSRISVNNSFVNFLGVSFAPSGFGKDLSLSIMENNSFVKYFQDIIDGIIRKYEIDIEDDALIIPSSYKIPLNGTIEGVMRLGNFYNTIPVGSINIVENEFGSMFNKDILNFIIKMYQDGRSDGAITVNQKYRKISDVPLNALLFGSITPFENDTKLYNTFISTLKSGLARRCIFVNINNNRIEPSNEEYYDKFEYPEDIIEFIKDNIGLNYDIDFIYDLLDEYNLKLIEKYNKEPTEINSILLSNREKLIRLSALIAIIHKNTTIKEEHFNIAKEIIDNSDKNLIEIFKPKPLYKKFYDYLKIKGSIFKIEMLDELSIKESKREIDDNIKLLKQYAYFHNYHLRENENQLMLSELKNASLNEIIISYNNENKSIKSNVVTNTIATFFGKEKSIETLVKSDIDYFCFVHFENNIRNKKYAEQLINCIGLDIDDGMSIDEALELLNPYTYILYTTRNHRKEKNGLVADRFRVIIPLKREIYINKDLYKQFIINISEILGFEYVIDRGTLDISRAWFTNKEADVYINNKWLLDPVCCIPNTINEQNITKVIKDVKDELNTQNTDKRIAGIIKWAISNAYSGNRNTTLFRATMFINDLVGSNRAKEYCLYINSKLQEPLAIEEIEKTIFKRLN